MNTLPPFDAYRRALYNFRELLSGFDAAVPASFTQTPDFEIYRHYVSTGGSEANDYFITMMQALHDHAITQNIRTLLAASATRRSWAVTKCGAIKRLTGRWPCCRANSRGKALS